MSHVTTLHCASCKKHYLPSEIDTTCPTCGPLRGTLHVAYDYDAVARELTKHSLAQNRDFSLWRYLPLLPISKFESIQPLAVGWTPIYPANALAEELGLHRLWLKDDSRNPTASLKDRASAVAVVKALEKGVTTVTAASTGNAASSWAAFTALAGLETIIFVPSSAPRAKVAQLLLYGATVLQVKGTYDEAFDLCCRAAEEWGWYNRSTAINPFLGEGKKTAAFEICEQLDWQVPDYVFVAVGDGCIFQGLWKGFKDFHAVGLIDRLPKLIGVQAAGSAPLVHAWEAGAEMAEPVVPQTIADSISVGVPRDQVKALQAVRESGGGFLAVPDAAILSAISTLARTAGIFAEPAGAAGLAGLQHMATAGELPADATAVVLVTGHGLKDIDGVLQAVDREPITLENSIDAVQEQMTI